MTTECKFSRSPGDPVARKHEGSTLLYLFLAAFVFSSCCNSLIQESSAATLVWAAGALNFTFTHRVSFFRSLYMIFNFHPVLACVQSYNCMRMHSKFQCLLILQTKANRTGDGIRKSELVFRCQAT